MIKVGCCGFPVKREIYYRNFSVVEIQQTFYHPPQIHTGRRWREEAPADFEFSMKAWQLITHEPSSPTYRRLRIPIPEAKKKYYGFFKNTEEVDLAWAKTAEFAHTLGVKKILFQTPKSFGPEEDHIRNLRNFFNRIERHSFTFIWEPRGQWQEKEVLGLCKELSIIPCLDPFKGSPFKGDLLYLRLHGRAGYHYHYSDEELLTLLKMVKSSSEAYLMFNNIQMVEDAKRVQEFQKKMENP